MINGLEYKYPHQPNADEIKQLIAREEQKIRSIKDTIAELNEMLLTQNHWYPFESLVYTKDITNLVVSLHDFSWNTTGLVGRNYKIDLNSYHFELSTTKQYKFTYDEILELLVRLPQAKSANMKGDRTLLSSKHYKFGFEHLQSLLFRKIKNEDYYHVYACKGYQPHKMPKKFFDDFRIGEFC